jgi:hypothetical protein
MVDSRTNETQRGFPRQQTIEFAPDLQRPRGRPEHPAISEYEPGLTPGDAQTSDLREFAVPNYECD